MPKIMLEARHYTEEEIVQIMSQIHILSKSNKLKKSMTQFIIINSIQLFQILINEDQRYSPCRTSIYNIFMSVTPDIMQIFVGNIKFSDTCQDFIFNITNESNKEILSMFFNVFLYFLEFNNSVLVSTLTHKEEIVDNLLANIEINEVNSFLTTLLSKPSIHITNFIIDSNLLSKLTEYVSANKQASRLLFEIVQYNQFNSSVLQSISDPDTIYLLFDEYDANCYDVLKILLKNRHLKEDSWDTLYEQFPDLCMRINGDQENGVSVEFSSMTELFKEILKAIISKNAGNSIQNRVSLTPQRKPALSSLYASDRYVGPINSLSSARSCPIFDIELPSVLPTIDEVATPNSILMNVSENHEYDSTIVKTTETILTKMVTTKNQECFRNIVLDIFDLIINTDYLFDLLLQITNVMNILKNSMTTSPHNNCKQSIFILNKILTPTMGLGMAAPNLPIRSSFVHASFSCETIPE